MLQNLIIQDFHCTSRIPQWQSRPALKNLLKSTVFKTKAGNSDKLLITSLNLFKQNLE